MPSPNQWLGLFMTAKYVVTNSFHGTAFSINFNKTFFSFYNTRQSTSTNSRIEDILRSTNLLNRLNNYYDDDKIDLTPPDYGYACDYLNRMRSVSLRFLLDVLPPIRKDIL